MGSAKALWWTKREQPSGSPMMTTVLCLQVPFSTLCLLFFSSMLLAIEPINVLGAAQYTFGKFVCIGISIWGLI